MISALRDRYRCPDDFLQFDLTGRLSADSGYFRFGHDAICYGRSASGYRTGHAQSLLYGTLRDVRSQGSTVLLPFNPTEVIDNLRFERFAKHNSWSELGSGTRLLRDLYYFARPWMSIGIRKHIQRAYLRGWQNAAFPRWPVDTTVEQISDQLLLSSMRTRHVDRVPFIWFWPDGARSCVVMTHDVEAQPGYNFCRELMAIDDSFGVKASFQVVPEGSYKVADAFLQEIRGRGFEVNIQDLNHDGRLFCNRQEFLRRAAKINEYGQMYHAKGFRAAVLYRNLNWYHALDFSYDMSVPNVAHLDPQHGGCCTVMPYFVGDILEIPLTTTQDYMLFYLLRNYSLDLWKAQTEAILKKNGLINFLVHPDYVTEKRARGVYLDLLCFLRNLGSQERLWFALPGEVDQWWRDRSKMRVVNHAGQWRVEGPGAEHAVLAFAKAAGDHLEYELSAELTVPEGSKA
ncbi:MAG: hypothetical protein WCC92_13825 [Candidatus Korobacteraceae bacterium]